MVNVSPLVQSSLLCPIWASPGSGWDASFFEVSLLVGYYEPHLTIEEIQCEGV